MNTRGLSILQTADLFLHREKERPRGDRYAEEGTPLGQGSDVGNCWMKLYLILIMIGAALTQVTIVCQIVLTWATH